MLRILHAIWPEILRISGGQYQKTLQVRTEVPSGQVLSSVFDDPDAEFEEDSDQY